MVLDEKDSGRKLTVVRSDDNVAREKDIFEKRFN